MLAVGQMDGSGSGTGSGSRQSAFLLSTPPLAALHSMTELKTPLYQNPAYQNHQNQNPDNSSPNPGGMAGSSPGLKTSSTGGPGLGPGSGVGSSATPHGINDILSRPSLLGLSSSSGGVVLSGLQQVPVSVPVRFGSLSPPPPPGLYFSPGSGAVVGRYPKPLTDLPGRTPIFWPGVLQSPHHWRDRFCSPRESRTRTLKNTAVRTCIRSLAADINQRQDRSVCGAAQQQSKGFDIQEHEDITTTAHDRV